MKPAKKIYGIIGYPVKHSLSPLMQNAAFKARKIKAEYKLFPLEEKEIKNFLHSLSENNILGLNVTVPYKEKVTPFLDSVSKEAKLIGAVNTIKVVNKKLKGFNTDAAGFIRHLTGELKFNPKGKVIAVIGAGGAAKAICVSLSQKKPKAITIYDIDSPKALALVNSLKNNFSAINFKLADSIRGLDIKGSDLLINATPQGMDNSDPDLVDKNFLHRRILVYDLIYNPQETNLLKLARARGAVVSNGLGMLLYQGAASFEIWTNKPAPVKKMREALDKGVKKL